MTVMTLNIHHKGDHGVPVPRLVQKICFDRLLARLLCLRAYSVDDPQAENAATVSHITISSRDEVVADA